MAKRDWFDDYMDYQLSGCEEDSPSDDQQIQTSGCLPTIIGVLAILWIISELFY